MPTSPSLAALAAGLALTSVPARAQRAERARQLTPTTLAFEAGFGTSPGGKFGKPACGISPNVSLGGSLVRRFARMIVVEANAAVHSTVELAGCDFILGVPHSGGTSGAFRPRAVVADRDPSRHAFASTIVRAGLETPREWTDGTVFRVTGGAGRMWGVDVPFRTLRATSLIGRGRVLTSVAVERWWYGLPVSGFDPALVTSPEQLVRRPPDNALRHMRVHFSTLRIGAEWLLGAQ